MRAITCRHTAKGWRPTSPALRHHLQTVNGEMKSHRLIRADLFMSDEASQAFFRKARLVIAEQGESLLG
ncbi:MAG: HlyU family transcriptional regulator [Nitratireductor sp.]